MTEQEQFLKTIEELENEDTEHYQTFYNGYLLLNMKDLDGNVPEIFICSGNRTAGKTFFFKRFLVRYALKSDTKFLWLTRKKTQLNTASQAFIEDISNCRDFTHEFTVDGSDFAGVKEIIYGGMTVGYVSYLNYADDIKEASNMFNSVSIIGKDEFQLPNEKDYVDNEVWKFRSIHKSCARGYGKHSRFLPVILVSNMISIINPYFVAFGIHRRIDKSTRKMRGNGWCFQLTYNDTAAQMAKQSAFEKAFGEDEQSMSDNFNQFMDSLGLVGKQKNPYLKIVCVFHVEKRSYGLWAGKGYYYVSTKIDPNCRYQYAMDVESHTENTVLIQRYNPLFSGLRKYFEAGAFRFQDVECRAALIDAIAVSVL